MNSIYRRLGGLAIALLMIPVLIGLLACLPVPIGDPERSRIDPELSGHWLMVSPDDVMLAVFEPYDKRTWLVRLVSWSAVSENDLEIDPETSVEEFEFDPDEDVEEIIIEPEGREEVLDNYEAVVAALPERLEGDEPALYKVWRTKLGKYWYLTWEIKGEKDFEPDEWLVFRLEKINKDRFDLSMLVDSAELFADVPETRRAYQRVIRRNQDSPLLFGVNPDDDEDERMTYVLYRIADDDWDRFERVF